MAQKRVYSERMRRLALRLIARATAVERQTILSDPEWFVSIDEYSCTIKVPEYYNVFIGGMVDRSLHLELLNGELYIYDSNGDVLHVEYIGDGYDDGRRRKTADPVPKPKSR